jgi:hypothetical protein
MIHIKTAEGLIQAATRQIDIIEPETTEVRDAKVDVLGAIKELQETMHALKLLCEESSLTSS